MKSREKLVQALLNDRQYEHFTRLCEQSGLSKAALLRLIIERTDAVEINKLTKER